MDNRFEEVCLEMKNLKPAVREKALELLAVMTTDRKSDHGFQRIGIKKNVL